MDHTLAVPGIDPMAPHLLAAYAFLSNYENEGTRKGYATDLRIYFTWCADTMGIDPLAAQRLHVQLFVRYLAGDRGYQPSGIQRTMTAVRMFYKNARLDGYLTGTPTEGVKTPKVIDDPTKKTHLDRWEWSALLKTAQEASPRDLAMVHLLSTIGMRVGAVCAVDIEDITTTNAGYRVLHTIGKGGVASLKALPIPVAQAVDAARGDRTDGPLLLRRNGTRMTRRSAGWRIDWLAKKAGIAKHLYPHALRVTHVTMALKSGVELHVVQRGVDHADPRTTMRYNALDVPVEGQASHTLSALLAAS
jgi:integrase/recombinase XerD